MAKPLTAKHERPDGTLCAQVEVPVFFTGEEAARALALVYPEQAPLRGEREFRMGLSRAARERILTRAGVKPDEQLVQAYLPIVDRHWTTFFKYDENREWVGSGHERASRARFDVAAQFSIDEAARALALVYERVPARVGRMTVQRGLREAAERRVLSRESAGPADTETVERWRGWLDRVGPWTQEG